MKKNIMKIENKINKKESKKLLLFFIIFIILLLSSCTKSQKNNQNDPIKRLQAFAIASVEHPNIKAPDFELTDHKENRFGSKALSGKVYVLQGFTPGCASCAQEIQTLNKVYAQYEDKGLEIISLDISSLDIKPALDAKKRFNGGDWRWAIDTDDVALKFQMRSLESTYIVDKEGIIRYKDESLSNSNILMEEVGKLI